MARSRKRPARPPANPAVGRSLPGAASSRTDGGAGQPIRSFPAQFQGQRQQLAQQQAAAPLATGQSPVGAQPGAGSTPPLLAQSPFRPTDRPDEPVTEGIPFGPGGSGAGVLPPDPDELLRSLARIFPHPHLLSLLRLRQ